MSNTATTPRILHAGDSCVVVEFGNSIDMEISARVQALREKIEKAAIRGVIETIPTYRSLAVSFNPLLVQNGFDGVLLRMAEGTASAKRAGAAAKKIVFVPSCYEGEHAPAIEKVAANAGISTDEVVRRHSAAEYYCYMLGFSPGQPYLGGMDPSLETPRLKEPLEMIPGGSVEIGGKQAGIRSLDSPGGWNQIGRTPLRMFDPGRKPAIFLEPGMWVRFVPISAAEFKTIASEAALPGWKPDIRELKEAG